VDHIIEGLRQAILDRRLYPVLCASGLHNIGTSTLLDFVCDYFPRSY